MTPRTNKGLRAKLVQIRKYQLMVKRLVSQCQDLLDLHDDNDIDPESNWTWAMWIDMQGRCVDVDSAIKLADEYLARKHKEPMR